MKPRSEFKSQHRQSFSMAPKNPKNPKDRKSINRGIAPQYHKGDGPFGFIYRGGFAEKSKAAIFWRISLLMVEGDDSLSGTNLTFESTMIRM